MTSDKDQCEHDWQEIIYDYPIMRICRKCRALEGLPIRFPIMFNPPKEEGKA